MNEPLPSTGCRVGANIRNIARISGERVMTEPKLGIAFVAAGGGKEIAGD